MLEMLDSMMEMSDYMMDLLENRMGMLNLVLLHFPNKLNLLLDYRMDLLD
jgi:hypothetical protein